jgi:hypothetical protein
LLGEEMREASVEAPSLGFRSTFRQWGADALAIERGCRARRFRNKDVGETGTLSSNQLIGALQEAPLRLRSGAGGGEFGVAAGGFGDGGNDVSIFLSAKYLEVGDGLSGKGFDVLCGSGGAVLIKLLNDLTDLSIPSSDEVDLFMCRNGDGRKWPPVSWLRIITTCGPKEVGCSGSVDEKSNAAPFLPSSRRVVVTKGVKCTCGSSLAAALGAFQRLDKADAVVWSTFGMEDSASGRCVLDGCVWFKMAGACNVYSR